MSLRRARIANALDVVGDDEAALDTCTGGATTPTLRCLTWSCST